jgi:error-prone DNA polymerase
VLDCDPLSEPRGALRDVGKAMGLSEDLIKMLSSQSLELFQEGRARTSMSEELNLNLERPAPAA